MRRCSVLECKNTSKSTASNATQVSYHKYPAGGPDRDVWILASGRLQRAPRDNTYICSEHFHPDAFTMETSERCLLEDALPTRNIHICRICLSSDRKMYVMKEKDLSLYTSLTGLCVNEVSVSQLICWECRARLLSAMRFRKKAIESFELLNKLLGLGAYYLLDIPKERKNKNLNSNLEIKQFDSNYTDYNLKYEPKLIPQPLFRKRLPKTTRMSNTRKLKSTQRAKVKIEAINNIEGFKQVNDDITYTVNDIGHSLEVDVQSIPAPHKSKLRAYLNTDKTAIDDAQAYRNDSKRYQLNNTMESLDKSEDIQGEMDPLFTTTKLEDDSHIQVFPCQVEVKTESVSSNADKSANIQIENDIRLQYEVKFESIEPDSKVSEISECSSDDDQSLSGGDTDNTSDSSADIIDEEFEKSDDEDLVKIAKRALGKREVAKISRKISEMVERGKHLCSKQKKIGVRRKSVFKNSSETKKEKRKPKVGRGRKPEFQLNDNIFTSKIITHEEQLREIENRKVSTNYKSSQFKCNMCFKGFVRKEPFNTHMARHSDQAGHIECPICKIRFKSGHTLNTHRQLHSQKHSCKLCTYVTNDASSARLHEKYHDGLLYKCPHCPEVYNKMSSYMSHLRIQHKSDIVCELCGNSFVSALGLTQHKSLKHRFDAQQEVPPEGPTCVDCNIKFLNQQALDTHMKQSAKHVVPASSGKGLRRPISIRRESRRVVQTPKGPLPCEICNEELPNFKVYYHHFKREHPGKTRSLYSISTYTCLCDVCGRILPNSTYLADHKLSHTGKQFKCGQCGKCFPQRMSLLRHEKYHGDNIQKHACNVCGREFTFVSNLVRHKRTHSDVRPHKCEICDKWFKTKGERRSHTMYVHMKKPWPKRDRGTRQRNAKQEAQDSA